MSYNTYLYTCKKRGGMNPARLVTIDNKNFVDGATPLEDFTPYFTLPVYMSTDMSEDVFMGILSALDDDIPVDVQAIYNDVVIQKGTQN